MTEKKPAKIPITKTHPPASKEQILKKTPFSYFSKVPRRIFRGLLMTPPGLPA